ncbi:Holliday junction resolvase RecU [Listeria sp. SHR_NRA_18]|uniref:Holliday junction resolvase RecU n=1 Tax=Listeria sp. SHR_NRA_18 TaxID=2269046 RepID=UPI000564D451|nr:Holliday junction resolvase RecU [Listeria sp. SHR_NRA_18]
MRQSMKRSSSTKRPATQNRQYANKGKELEGLLENVCFVYKMKGVGLIHKIPNEWTVKRAGGRIVEAFPSKKSTVDFEGILQGGISIAFEAKETTNKTSFPLDNIKEHQLEFLRSHDRLGGCSFLILRFVNLNKIFKIEYKELEKMIQECKEQGRKSIPVGRFSEIGDGCNLVTMRQGLPDFMEAME